MSLHVKRRAYQIIEAADDGDTLSRAFDIFIMSLIALNVLVVILETVPSLHARFAYTFHMFDLVSVTIFTLEYLARLWVCTADPKYSHPVWGRLRFMISPMATIDLLAIAPFYLPMLLPMDLRELRALRLFRFFRVFKFARYSQSLRTMGRVFAGKREELMIALIIELFLLVFVSSVMYSVEHDAQPDKFSSIPAAMWWGIVTLTTVGYGDVAPVTIAGKLCAAALALIGVAMFALPAGIFASGFSENVQRRRRRTDRCCPHCGKHPNEKLAPGGSDASHPASRDPWTVAMRQETRLDTVPYAPPPEQPADPWAEAIAPPNVFDEIIESPRYAPPPRFEQDQRAADRYVQ